eukprot:6214568-Pleurochrysis_carterae.AAC.1
MVTLRSFVFSFQPVPASQNRSCGSDLVGRVPQIGSHTASLAEATDAAHSSMNGDLVADGQSGDTDFPWANIKCARRDIAARPWPTSHSRLQRTPILL